MKPNTGRSLQVRRSLQLKRANGQEVKGPAGKSQPRWYEGYEQPKSTVGDSPPVIQREEMVAFFTLFGELVDGLIPT